MQNSLALLFFATKNKFFYLNQIFLYLTFEIKFSFTIKCYSLLKEILPSYVNSDLADHVQISNVRDIIIHRVKQNNVNRTFQPVGNPLQKHRPLSSFTILKKQKFVKHEKERPLGNFSSEGKTK